MSDTDADALGRELRHRTPLDAHDSLIASPRRSTLEQFLHDRNRDRRPDLVPLAHARMTADSFAFFRGSAGLMAADLAESASTGLVGQICGDAHAANFGLYGSHDGRIVMDINDFDETAVGPWEWDLKRLAVSVVLAARATAARPSPVGRASGRGSDAERDTDARARRKLERKAARHAAKAYRHAHRHLAILPFTQSWTALGDEAAIARAEADALIDAFAEASADAVGNTSEKLTTKAAHRHDGDNWHFVIKPPILTEVEPTTQDEVAAALPEYLESVHRSRGRLLERYRLRDVAHRIVGTGSIGMRSYLLLMQGNGNESLILQVKQAGASALASHLPPELDPHHGRRVVLGARLVQAETDPLYGWTTVEGRPFTVRQFRNRKGSIDVAALPPRHLDDYARLAGALLARAHSRTIDPRVLAAYLDDGKAFDAAIGELAVSYADIVESDHAQLCELISSGHIDAGQRPDA